MPKHRLTLTPPPGAMTKKGSEAPEVKMTFNAKVSVESIQDYAENRLLPTYQQNIGVEGQYTITIEEVE